MHAPLPSTPEGYGCILADPPWQFRNRSAKGMAKNPERHYDCMDVNAISEMRVANIAAENSALLLWATAPMLPAAFYVMSSWGFDYKTTAAWAKQSRTGNAWAFGTGYIMRSAAEFLLVGTRGRPKVQNRSTRNLIVAPVQEHSRKPDCVHAMAEALYTGPYVELFARRHVSGWNCWGNQLAGGEVDTQTSDLMPQTA
jgi:N6-adenosine-specific RNA methylase IME4